MMRLPLQEECPRFRIREDYPIAAFAGKEGQIEIIDYPTRNCLIRFDDGIGSKWVDFRDLRELSAIGMEGAERGEIFTIIHNGFLDNIPAQEIADRIIAKMEGLR
jgi:hypothetical protein